MPATSMESPSVALSFANNFWGKEDAGVGPLIDRMLAAKQTCDELKAFYSGSQESGSLKTSLDTVRGEVESMAKQHQSIAAQVKTELEEPLAAFAGGMKERRKIVQIGIEKILKTKIQQTQHVNKTRDRFEQECLKIKGYLAQGHMVMGQEERKNKAKLEKTQISVATSNTEYENAVKALEDTTVRWNREWKAAADKFQDLEEERLDFTKSSLWTFANISSTVCVSDDASCEKIRLSLEKMDVETDIVSFIKEQGTGQEIPDPPKYINFCRGDINDTQSESSDDDSYSVAQFPRSINPAFRSSSPQPSTYESHHDPNSSLAQDLGHKESVPPASRSVALPDAGRKEAGPSASRHAAADTLRTDASSSSRNFAPELSYKHASASSRGHALEQGHDDVGSSSPRKYFQEMGRREMVTAAVREMPLPAQRIPPLLEKSRQPAPVPQQQHQHQQHQQQQQQQQQQHSRPHPDKSQTPTSVVVPHDPYPLDGMTMLCRTGPPSERSSQPPSARPSSRDSQSDYSNPTSLSSQEPPSGKVSPIKQEQVSALPPASDKHVLKKRSGFFQNHSPFRRKSTKETPRPSANRNTWHPVSAQGSPSRRPQLQTQEPSHLLGDRSTISPEPIDANATLALNVGQNVFSVTNPDLERRKGSNAQPAQPETDPIALALAELKGVGVGKQSSVRVSADRYHGIATPTPGSQPFSRSVPPAASNGAVAAGLRGTPPPYDQQVVQRLGVPPQAVTAKAMKETSQKFADQTRTPYLEKMRPGSSHVANDMAIQLAPLGDENYGSVRGRGGNRPGTSSSNRAMGLYEGGGPPGQGESRQRSKSVADPSRQYTRDGRPILHFARALYMYQAAIPEELGFSKGDLLAVLRHQDDGWWEAEVHGSNGRMGLVPSNYLQPC
ncbi:Septation protein imp2 [Colletotrichum tanaceti]|nr:Septation protein imp2 [Colletotrichum tanaceti]